jgi:hypothetical protein
VKTLERLAGAQARDIRIAALRALGKRSEPEARAVVTALAADPSIEVRILAVEAQTEVARVEAAVADESPEVRGAAVGALVRVAGPATAAPTAFRLLANAKSARERVMIAHAWLVAGSERRPSGPAKP